MPRGGHPVNKAVSLGQIEFISDDRLIRVAGGYIPSLNLTWEEHHILKDQLVQEILCPVAYYFNDVPDVRRILRIKDQP